MTRSVLLRWILPVGLILLLGLGGVVAIALRHDGILGEGEGGGTSAVEPAPPPPEPEIPFSFIFGGEVRGRIGAPPCSQFKFGGLARVSSVVQKMTSRSAASILMDTGDLPHGEGEAGAIELATALDIFREAGLAVAAVGERDLLVGLDRWREAKNKSGEGVAILCANLRDDAGEALLPSVATFTLGNRRIQVTAILSPSFEPELRAAGVLVRILPPVEAVRDALKAAGKGDMVVLISHAPVEESRELLKALPEVRLAITAHAGDDPWHEPEVVDGRFLMAPGTGWQYISATRFVGRPFGGIDHIDTHNRVVGPKATASDIAMMRMRETMMRLQAKGVLEGSLGEGAARLAGAPAYTGPSACASCHPAAHEKWKGEEDPHARSMTTIRKMKQDSLTYCLQCHATAVAKPGGHLKPRDEQAAVTCEACHGNGAAHVAADGRVKMADARVSCLGCHTTEMDPAFEYDVAWPKIVHGR